MKKSVDYLKELIELSENDWKKKLDSYLNDKDKSDIEDEEPFAAFILAFKEEIINNNMSDIDATEALIDNDLLYNDLRSYVDKLLNVYHTITPLRVLEVKDYALAQKAIDYIFEYSIVRYHPDFDSEFKKYGFNTQNEILNVYGVLNSLCSFAIDENLHIDAIYIVAKQNTKLSDKTCKYIAEKINQNFEQLRFKQILSLLAQK